MKRVLLKYSIYLGLLFILGCSLGEIGPSYFFQPMTCQPEPMPIFDYTKVKIFDRKTNRSRDTILGEIPKMRDIFKPCREMTYRAIFKTPEGKLISDNLIRMMATGKRWEFQPEKQDEIAIQYQFTHSEFLKNQKYQLNKTLKNDQWQGEVIEGIIENADEIWMHPFRSNQYNFTEVAPFPKIEYPNKFKVGFIWSSNLSIGDGWGDWANTSGSSIYEVVSQEDITTPYGKIEDCWKVVAKSKWDFGESTLDFWFHKKLGFVKMDYVNYGGQTLEIELVEVNDG